MQSDWANTALPRIRTLSLFGCSRGRGVPKDVHSCCCCCCCGSKERSEEALSSSSNRRRFPSNRRRLPSKGLSMLLSGGVGAWKLGAPSLSASRMPCDPCLGMQPQEVEARPMKSERSTSPKDALTRGWTHASTSPSLQKPPMQPAESLHELGPDPPRL